MHGVGGDLFHTEQYRNESRRDNAFTASAVADEQQPYTARIVHPVDHLVVFRQMVISGDRRIQPAKERPKECIAHLAVAPRETCGTTDDQFTVGDHPVNKGCDILLHTFICLSIRHSLPPSGRSFRAGVGVAPHPPVV